MSFLDQLKRAAHFFSQSNLAETPVRYSPAPGDVELHKDMALLVIDVQKAYCSPWRGRGNLETHRVSKRIRKLVPEFRKAGIPVYVIYYSEEPKAPNKIGFYKFQPSDTDVLIAKDKNSAFQGSDIKNILQRDGRRQLLTCGFNLNACVCSTVIDAVAEGFDVRLLRDLTGNDNENDRSTAEGYVQRMKDKGVTVTFAADELRRLTAPAVG